MSLNLDKSKWKRVRFGDVVRNVNDTVRDPESAGIDRVVAMEHMDPGNLSISRWGTLEAGTSFSRRVKPGQTLFGKRRAYQRKVAFAEFDAICSGDILTFEAEESEILADFLPFLVQSDAFFDHALGTSAGSLSPRTNWRDLAKFEFRLPPLDQQKRIADLLWTVERHRSARLDVFERTKLVRNVTRAALLIFGINGDWRKGAWGTAHLECWTVSVPDGWSRATIGSVSRVRSGATPIRSEHEKYFRDGQIPWVKTLDLNEELLLETDECITPTAVAETSARIVPSGTVLVAMYGGFMQIGRTARLGIDAATNQAVSAMLELREDVLPEFLHEVLKAGRPKWRKVAASSRKDPNITKRDVEAFDFPLPPPDVQSEILSVLAGLQQSIDAATVEAQAIIDLRTALFDDIFGGD